MSNIADRLTASLKYGALHGDAFERGVVANQLKEAVDEIKYLQKELARHRVIAGCFEKGDWTRLGNLNEYIQYDHRDLFSEEKDALQRLRKAAKHAEDSCK